MTVLRGLKLRPGESEEKLYALARRELGRPVADIKILRRSLDARRLEPRWVYSVEAIAKDESFAPESEYIIPRVAPRDTRPVVAGFGPAGIFAALVLSRAGLCPIVLERGDEAHERRKKVDAFRNGWALDPECNVQFGEGGAGTFSDGKLNTGTHDGRIGFVLREFYRHGAPGSVLTDAKPHVGTDILIDVVTSLRREIVSLGGEVRFSSRLDGLDITGGELRAVRVSSRDGQYVLPCRELILAVGHSARDTFDMLSSSGVPMERKGFSMGARIEHRQADIDLSQYGSPRGRFLPPADYSLSVHLPDGRSAYTFCMCPGGEVIAAASEAGGVVTNGMSYHARDGENANSALLVTLPPESFPYPGVLGGMLWQREIERRAYEYAEGSYRATSQRVGDFLRNTASFGASGVVPSYKPGVKWGNLREVLPEYVASTMADALPVLGRKLKGFDSPDAVLTGPETRSSSPVRITRGADRQSAVRGLYPCGEGAGYAGGITSAAVDGVRCAEAVMGEI